MTTTFVRYSSSLPAVSTAPAPDGWITAQDFAAQRGVHRTTVLAWIKRGQLEGENFFDAEQKLPRMYVDPATHVPAGAPGRKNLAPETNEEYNFFRSLGYRHEWCVARLIDATGLSRTSILNHLEEVTA